MAAQSSHAFAIVRQWHEALQTHDLEKLTALVHKDVQISGPRGLTAGVQVLLDWVERAKVKLVPQRYFARDEVVVAEQLGEWRSPQNGEITGSQMVASVFAVKENLITSIMRYDNLALAFEKSGLNESALVQP